MIPIKQNLLPRISAVPSFLAKQKVIFPPNPCRLFSSSNSEINEQRAQKPVQASLASRRFQEFQTKLKIEQRNLKNFLDLPGRSQQKRNNLFEPSEKGIKFLKSISDKNIKYSRGGQNGEGYIGVREVINLLQGSKQYYSENEHRNLLRLTGEVQQRMRVKISKAYIDHALDVPVGANNPSRFDFSFWEVMDAFHKSYPDVRIEFVGHYVHPYELVKPKLGENQEYVYDLNLQFEIRNDIKPVLDAMNMRKGWIGHLNQFPIVAGVNDAPEVLRLLMYLTNKLGITMHNIYACREIIGNRHFRGNNTIDAQYALVEKAKIGLSGIENHGRLIMSTEYGKMEVIGSDGSEVLIRLNRFVHGKKPENTFIKVDLRKLGAGKKFYWLTDDIIKIAVGPEGQEILNLLTSEKNPSFIKKLKDNAAKSVFTPDVALLEDIPATSSSAEIEIILNHQIAKVISVDFSGNKKPTMATILSQHGHVEAACQEKLSCSTCVGTVQVTSPHADSLSEPTEDEMDVIDMVAKNIPDHPEKEIGQLRAGCNIPLKPGVRYKFAPVEGV